MDLTIRIAVFLVATLVCFVSIANLVLELKTPNSKILHWLKRLGGAYWKHPTYPAAYYEIGARLTVAGMMVQLVVLDLMLFLALFDYPLFTSITGKH